jgi:hypothetical protein
VDYIEIVDWQDTQHYSDRTTPWIKMEDSILDDYRYECLADNHKLILFSLYLLANKTHNKIPKDTKWIRKHTSLRCSIDLEPLLQSTPPFIKIESDGLPDAILTLSKRYQSKPKPEKETYGSFANVFLTKEEHSKLLAQFGRDRIDERIDNLSHYIESKGRQYRSHYATLLMWERKDKTDEPKLFDHRTVCRVCKKPKSPLIDGTCNECHEN